MTIRGRTGSYADHVSIVDTRPSIAPNTTFTRPDVAPPKEAVSGWLARLQIHIAAGDWVQAFRTLAAIQHEYEGQASSGTPLAHLGISTAAVAVFANEGIETAEDFTAWEDLPRHLYRASSAQIAEVRSAVAIWRHQRE